MDDVSYSVLHPPEFSEPIAPDTEGLQRRVLGKQHRSKRYQRVNLAKRQPRWLISLSRNTGDIGAAPYMQ
jgi:hypothetical protein